MLSVCGWVARHNWFLGKDGGAGLSHVSVPAFGRIECVLSKLFASVPRAQSRVGSNARRREAVARKNP